MSKYAIMGITGQVGGAAAEKLLSDGANIRAVVRDEAKAELWRVRGMEAAVAAYDDVDALKSAFSHVDGVFIMTPTWFSTSDMFEENKRAIYAIGSALRALPPTKVVLLSSIGAHLESGTGAIMKLHAMEKAFADLPFVSSIRAAWFMENIAGLIAGARTTGILPSLLAPLDRAVPMIATKDIGQQVAASLQSSWSGHNIIELERPPSIHAA